MKRQILTAFLAVILLLACGNHPVPIITPIVPTPHAVVEQALLSVGHLQGMKGGEEYGCTAFAIAERKFLTAAHCMGELMKLDGRPAFLVAMDEKLDLAVIVSDYVVPSLTIRKEPLTRQEQVIGLGYGYSWKFPLITRHFVVILNYTPWPDEVAPGTWFSGGFIGGQSGGCVIDLNGEVVGVIQRSDSQSGYGVDAATIQRFLDQSAVIVEHSIDKSYQSQPEEE